MAPTFGNPVPWAPIIVTSPGLGLGLLVGVYFLTASFKGASCVDVDRGYSRMYWLSTTYSLTEKGEFIMAVQLTWIENSEPAGNASQGTKITKGS